LRLLLLPFLAWSCPLTLRADKIHLKSGEVLTGTITEETPDLVRIQVLTGTIKDNRSVPRVSIDRIEKTTPEDVAYETCVPLKVTPDGLSANAYEERLKVVGEFLTKYPASKYKADVEAIRDSLAAEKERVAAGELRFRGQWLTPAQQAIHAPNLKADGLLRGMRQAAAARNYLAALRQFEVIEEECQGSLAFPEALADAKQLIPAWGRKMTNEIAYAKHQAAENAKGLASLQGSALDEAKRQLDAAAARFKAQVDAERAKKITWLSVDLTSETSLNEGIALAKKELERLSKIDPAPFAEQAAAFFAAGELIHSDKLDEAEAALKTAAATKGGMRVSLSSRPSSSTPKPGATTPPPSVPDVLRQHIAEKREKLKRAAELAARTESEAVKALGTSGAASSAPAAPPADAAPLSADDALDALVAQRTTTPAKPAAADAPGKSSAPAPKERERKPVGDRPPPVQRSGGGFPFPLLIGAIAVCLVGVTAFLYLQERKKQQG
jgi:hypothetical protein